MRTRALVCVRGAAARRTARRGSAAAAGHGTEQDGIIRELLAGDLADGPDAAVAWPEALRPALTTAGFATQLRDMLARCTERGVDGPAAAADRPAERRGPEWVAAGQFAQQYEQVMLLRAAAGRAAPQATVPALGAAELVGAALEAFATDPALLAAERERIGVLLVDDAQHLDPQAARLVAGDVGRRDCHGHRRRPEPDGVRVPRRRSDSARRPETAIVL